MEYVSQYLEDAKKIIDQLEKSQIIKIIDVIKQVRKNKGRLFIIGVGGGAGHASHAVNDFRKICGIEAYTPTDNVSELTARVNDDGWETSYKNWLQVSKLSGNDALLVFSVGGGNREKNVSVNIITALKYAEEVKAKICGIVGKDGGYTARVSNACVIIPPVNQSSITPQTESFQAVIWHLIVAHPELQQNEMKWESVG
jgi:D-sedoheptulose 7-phosphate isomerase